jgi:NADPH:quinone reductase
MKAIVIARAGGPEVLELREVADPVPGPGEVRVRVQATALNRADLMQRRGAYPAPSDSPQDIPGLEFAGTIDRLGSGVSGWQPGQTVMGLVGGGSYAEYVVTRAAELVPQPQGLSWEQAAAVPEAFMTAHDALVTQLGLRKGERVLIHGIASGVGTAALQLAHAIGAAVIGTTRTIDKLERLDGYGLTATGAFHGVDVTTVPFVDAVRQATEGAGVDVVLDLVGGDYLAGNLASLRPRGRLLVVGLVAGSTAELDMRTLLNKRLRISGTVMRSRSPDEKAQVAQAFARDALELLQKGRLRPIIDRILPLAQAADAHRHMEENANVGKIVLRV